MNNPIYCALDTTDADTAQALATKLKPHVGGLKLGLEFFLAHGASGTAKIAALDLPIFLDMKLHDIPNTVAGAIRALLPLQPAYITLHASGGPAMMQAAAEAAAKAGANRPKLLGVTVLTSLNADDLETVGQNRLVEEQVKNLARLARHNGLDGVICSPTEIAALRKIFDPSFVLMVPGIRPVWAAANDQKRVMTPEEALHAGATHLVIGRPITAAPNPTDAARRIAAECGL